MFAQNLIIPSVLLVAGHLTAAELKYPEARKESVTDVYHGTEVKDPYRWLEDDNSAETKAWVSAENKVTDGFIKTIPQRDEIHARLKKLWNYERIGLPYEEGGKWFYSKNSGLQNQAVLYVADTLDGEPRVLLDPNTMSKDGTVALAQSRPSEDGRLLAYATSGGGSDWLEIRVRDIATGKDLEDHLKWVKFSGMSWAKDNSGFYYSRYDAPKEGAALTQKNEFQKLYFHKLGDPQEKDTLIYERKDQPQWGIGGGVTEDGRYLIIHLSQGSDTKNRVFYKSLETPDAEVVQLLPDGDADYGFLGNNGSVFYFKTDLDAPRFRVIAIDTKNPDRKEWKEIIPQTAEPLDDVSKVGGKLIATYMKDAKSRVVRFDADGKNPKELELPGIGTVGGFGGEEKDTSVFYSHTSFTNPGAIYQLDLAGGGSKLWKKPEVGFEGGAYVTEQVFFESKDGTKVPMFIVRKKDAPMDGSNRTLLYGYGGFQINMLPGFSVARAVWLERGGILVVVNLRGGGEYGTEWHEAGKISKKQNVFDDFIGAAETLIKKGYTKSANLAIQGGSNGGLLVGACMTQRPELFGAALPAVGVMDMLRFQKFTIGWAWQAEYGSSDKAKDFPLLHKYSPYHALKPETRYPATLVSTADHDDRVVPAHSFKFAARLQEYQAKDGPPVLIRIETSAGHGAGTSLTKVMDRTADEWAFLEAALPGK
ncbi:S9 family peptidase [Luteolibacter yonseiensis]|uniref:prolyl oligopeptidase n=1 Tax=Luteolibacter yonseiensis TaxID=1144680 RepID=A0A934R4I1_9BACT|nr:prolyl oligopeptidase family serine peptidase [Luteolibacter yonseiensis]MBK1815029.1 S9 family peptidase [Luteolibacter yonseiensis]